MLNDLEFYAYHGVYAEERKLGQKLVINLDIKAEIEDAARTDRIDDTVDYTAVYECVKDIVAGDEKHRLLEHLAHRIIQAVLEGFSRVTHVSVRIRKPSVPYPGIGSCEVKLEGGR